MQLTKYLRTNTHVDTQRERLLRTQQYPPTRASRTLQHRSLKHLLRTWSQTGGSHSRRRYQTSRPRLTGASSPVLQYQHSIRLQPKRTHHIVHRLRLRRLGTVPTSRLQADAIAIAIMSTIEKQDDLGYMCASVIYFHKPFSPQEFRGMPSQRP